MQQVAKLAAVSHQADRYQQAYQQQSLQPMYPYGQRHLQQGYPYQSQKSEQCLYQNSLPVEIATVAPPTPPAEDMFRPQTLPSISSLLDISPVKRADSIAVVQHQNLHQHRQDITNAQQYSMNVSQHQQQHLPSPPPHDEDVMSMPSAIEYVQATIQNSRASFAAPATPPLVHDSIQSPSAMSTASTMSMPQTYYLSPVAGQVRHQARSFSEPNILKPHSMAVQQHYPAGFSDTPLSVSPASYYSPGSVTQSFGMLAQRPLPSNFPPTFTSPFGSSQPLGLNISTSTNPWQHHHYIGASSQSLYTQSQDRYICPTCSKAFSRPSSLRIHSHSHTGEKPYKCSFAGCGKAFSVRSNMKRHERGCHGDHFVCEK